MMTATSPSKILTLAAAVALIGLIGIGAAAAEQMADGENGRYTMSPVAEGVIRLDTRTGNVSTCSNGDKGWACYVVPDERAALDAEIGRLQADNEKLKTELAARAPTVTGKLDEPLPKADSLKPPRAADNQRRIEIPLPSDRDMDRAMTFLEQAWRRLIEMANRVQKDASGKI